jgi:hypothetical protein
VKSAGKEAGIRMLQADGSAVAVGDFYMMICKELVLKGKDRCLAEINECVLTGDAHGTKPVSNPYQCKSVKSVH